MVFKAFDLKYMFQLNIILSLNKQTYIPEKQKVYILFDIK